MFRGVRRLILLAPLVALAVFVAVKLLPAGGGPPIEIHSEGGDQHLARSVLTSALWRLFPKGNGSWKLTYRADSELGLRCIAQSPAYAISTGRGITATYLFARWLEVRLADYVYSDPATARRASSEQGARESDGCYGRLVDEELHREGYAAVGSPRVTVSAIAGVPRSRAGSRSQATTRGAASNGSTTLRPCGAAASSWL